jgi:hypothetical protein
MKKILKLTAVVFLLIAFSCSKNNDSIEIDENEGTDGAYTICNSEDIIGPTSCCIEGKTSSKPGETLSYTYKTNTDNSVFKWKIISGSISIISGENSKTVTVKFGDDFNNGVIQCDGSGDLICNTTEEIKKE